MDLVNLLIGDFAEVGSPGEVLANEAVGVFIESSLLRMVRMGKKACRFEDFIDELMNGEFFAVIVSECMRLFSIGSQSFQDCCANCVCAFVCGFHRKRSAASSINDGDKHRS